MLRLASRAQGATFSGRASAALPSFTTSRSLYEAKHLFVRGRSARELRSLHGFGRTLERASGFRSVAPTILIAGFATVAVGAWSWAMKEQSAFIECSPSPVSGAVAPSVKPHESQENIDSAVSVSIHAKLGPRATMEDRWYVSEDLLFYGVFDGHGGHRVAELAKEMIYATYAELMGVGGGHSGAHIAKSLRLAFEATSEAVLADSSLDNQGSTSVCVVLCPEEFVTANVGDSRAILCREGIAINLSIDHKPDLESERARIEALGGVVRWHGYIGPDHLPVIGMGAHRINGNLAVSRAFGDKYERPFVSSEPEIFRFPRDRESDRFIIVASDGLWDAFGSQDAVDFVRQIMGGSVSAMNRSKQATSGAYGRSSANIASIPSDASTQGKNSIRAELDTRKAKMAHYLVEEALRRGSSDNVTAIVIWLK